MNHQLLWKPTQARIDQAHMTRFIDSVRVNYQAHVRDYASLYQWSIDNPKPFWNSVWDFARIVAKTRGTVTLTKSACLKDTHWYPQARLNFAENLLQHYGSEAAIIFHGEDQVKRALSWNDLHDQVASLTAALKASGVKKGDRVAALLANMPEAVIGMLATASLGAIWSSCSPDFGITGILDRFAQIRPKILMAVDGYYYNGKTYHLADKVAGILDAMPYISKTILVPYTNLPGPQWADVITLDAFTAPYQEVAQVYKSLPFDQPLYILYSSGTTGPPKCIVHSAGGTLLQHVKEHLLHVDVHAGDRLFYFTTCGWMMWNWLVSGLASGATLVLYDGSPLYPNKSVLFDLIDSEEIDIFGVSAKYIDTLRKTDTHPAKTHSLRHLKTVLSTGSPLVPENFDFVYQKIKQDVCLSSISGGTDIISCFALGAPVLPVWRGEIQCLGLGMKVEVFDDAGHALTTGKGELVCSAPFPSAPLGFWNDSSGQKFQATYFKRYPGAWHHGDFVELTEHGGMIIHGRSDTVLNPGGIRIGTAEIYRQLAAFREVIESLVVGQNWHGDVRIILFVQLKNGLLLNPLLTDKIRQSIRLNLTPRHVPAKIIQVADIPRTRSGKIVELAVRDVMHGRPIKNEQALANPEALEFFRHNPELEES